MYILKATPSNFSGHTATYREGTGVGGSGRH